MVVAETMAAIALAKAAVSGVKSVIDTCKDVSEISGQIDQMFHASEQIDKKLGDKGKSAYNQYLNSKLKDGEEAGGESFSDVAAEIIEKKQLEEQLDQMRKMLNRRFGADTWEDILELREERQKTNKIKRKKAKEKYLAKREHDRILYKKIFNGVWQTIVVSGAVGGLIWWLSFLSKCAGSCFK
jgi:predicted CopG family antitoxin